MTIEPYQFTYGNYQEIILSFQQDGIDKKTKAADLHKAISSVNDFLQDSMIDTLQWDGRIDNILTIIKNPPKELKTLAKADKVANSYPTDKKVAAYVAQDLFSSLGKL